MEKDRFYNMVSKMRQVQAENAHRHLTMSELMEQWQIEFLVDDELNRYSVQKSKNPKTPVTFATFSDQYCPN